MGRGSPAARRHPARALAAIGGLALFTSLATHALYPAPPQTHDEFSYLLAADTFLHGRLANPTHPHWPHFETLHVLQQPTYISKYPPLQGAILAVGTKLGDPAIGVALSFALACAASVWMLRAWVGRRWAVVGGLLLALHPQIVTVWGTWLWGGAGPLLGGALLYGAAPRLLCRPRPRDGLALAAGVALLANSRPYEGLVACLPVGWMLLRGTRRGDVDALRLLRRAGLPALAALALVLTWMGLYNLRTTGSALSLPYTVYNEVYASVPAFLFLSPGPDKTYRNDVFRAFYAPSGFESRPYHERRPWAGLVRAAREKLDLFWSFFARFGLSLPLLALPFALTDRRVRFALGAWALFGLALWVETYEQRHYVAPFVPLGLVILLACLRSLFGVAPRLGGRPRRLGAAAVVGLLIVAGFEHAGAARDLLLRKQRTPLAPRADIVQDLTARGGRHLVMVRYGSGHNVHEEWVYNGADIDAAPVVFARELSPEQDRALLQHFRGRRVWLLTPDARGAPLRPYPRARPAPSPERNARGERGRSAAPAVG